MDNGYFFVREPTPKETEFIVNFAEMIYAVVYSKSLVSKTEMLRISQCPPLTGTGRHVLEVYGY